MTVVAGLGVEVDVPPGWEAAIFRRDPHGEATTHAVVHLGNFPLPPDRGDFGSGAVDVMTHDDVLLVLLEYSPDSAGTVLFAEAGPPASVEPADFSTSTLQRSIPGHAGIQRFFTAAGRPFCFYAVLGAASRADVLVPAVNDGLGRISIGPWGGG